jgi:hypothetical protein
MVRPFLSGCLRGKHAVPDIRRGQTGQTGIDGFAETGDNPIPLLPWNDPMSSQLPPVAETAPTNPEVTDYDRAHMVTYLRLLDAAAEGAICTEVARIVLEIDPAKEPDRAQRAYDSHLARARWFSEQGYRNLLRPAS